MFRQVELSRVLQGYKVLIVVGLLAAASPLSLAVRPAPPSTPVSAAHARIVGGYSKLPLSFAVNRGQAAKDVKFLSRGNGYGLYLTAQEAILALRKPVAAHGLFGNVDKGPRLEVTGVSLAGSRASTPSGIAPDDADPTVATNAQHDRGPTDVLRLQLAGASFHTQPTGLDRLPGTANYFIGNDPDKWRTNVPTFARVRYAGVYPGVDLVYYGNQRQLEYDFVVAPGATPQPIRLRFDGASALGIETNGDLAIHTTGGTVAFEKPLVYQMAHGLRQLVDGGFELMADGTVGFDLGRYDHSIALVIDPILAYSTYFGGTDADFVVAVASDASGAAYVTGLTISEDFPTTAGAFQSVNYATTANTVSTAFISKFNASGTALLYSTYLGGVAISDTLHQQGDYGKAIAVDSAGNAYVTGYTYSTDFPVTAGAYQKSNIPAEHHLPTGFVTKLNANGTGLLYSTFLGGSLLDELTALAIDSEGDAYISGVSFSADFPTTPGVLQTTNKSYGTDGFNAVVAKLNPAGSALIYSTYLGGASSDGSTLGNIYWTNPIVVNKSGDAYVAGFTSSGDFPVTAGAFQTTAHGLMSVIVSKLNPTATQLLYSTYLGGSTTSICEGLAVDGSGNAYVAGYTSDIDFPVTKGAFQTVNNADTNTIVSAESNQNGFLTKINPTGTALVYSTYLGGTTGPWGGDQVYDLAVDSSGNAYVAGSAMSADFPVTASAYQSQNRGATHCCDYYAYTSNAFLTEFNAAGTALNYSTYLGGSGTQNPVGPGGSGDTAYGLSLAKNGNVYLVGFTTSSNFPLSGDAFETTYNTQQNTGFVANFDLGATPTTKETETTLTPSSNTVVPGSAVTFTASVAPVAGAAIPTGNVAFSIDEAVVAAVPLSASGKATYTTSGLAAGAHYVLASYTGSSSLAASADGLNEFVIPLTPVITPAGGTYESQQVVTIASPTKSGVVYYTLDGSQPSRFSTMYSKPITVDYSKTVKAVAVAESDANSVTATSDYTIVNSPWVLAAPATAIGSTNGTLTAFVNSLGLTGTYSFQYGTSGSALTSSTVSSALSASTTRVQASARLTGLKAKTAYYYRVLVTTAAGATWGKVLSFTTN